MEWQSVIILNEVITFMIQIRSDITNENILVEKTCIKRQFIHYYDQSHKQKAR